MYGRWPSCSGYVKGALAHYHHASGYASDAFARPLILMHRYRHWLLFMANDLAMQGRQACLLCPCMAARPVTLASAWLLGRSSVPMDSNWLPYEAGGPFSHAYTCLNIGAGLFLVHLRNCCKRSLAAEQGCWLHHLPYMQAAGLRIRALALLHMHMFGP